MTTSSDSNHRETPQERTARINRSVAELKREFKKRMQQLEHEHVLRLLALFDEFKCRSQAIAGHRTRGDNGTSIIDVEKVQGN
jgi:hypothetical protein